jgi:hypothetical protein
MERACGQSGSRHFEPASLRFVVILWPALLFIGDDKQTAAELGRLNREMDAIEQASIRMKTGFDTSKFQ